MRLISFLKKRFSGRSDSEHRQAILRLVIVSLSMVYALVVFSMQGGIDLPGTLMVAAAFLISLLIFLHIVLKPRANPPRRVVGIFHDNIFTTLFLASVGIQGALILFVYPFITIGNGFRFGVKYLAFCGALGTLGMAYLFAFNPSWQTEAILGYGVLLININVTLYTGILLRKLQQTQNKLEVMATHDALTGLPNRAYFMERLENTFLAKADNQQGIVCIYFDLDGFKSVNDIHGHKTGDNLLQSVAENVKKVIRSTDTFARLGGDEFTMLLDTKTSVADAIKLSQRVISAIEGIKLLNGKDIKVSCSIGIAHLSSVSEVNPMSPDELLKIADEAMYKAKKGGKGRFELVNIEPHQFSRTRKAINH